MANVYRLRITALVPRFLCTALDVCFLSAVNCEIDYAHALCHNYFADLLYVFCALSTAAMIMCTRLNRVYCGLCTAEMDLQMYTLDPCQLQQRLCTC